MVGDEGGDRVIGRVRRSWKGRGKAAQIDGYVRWALYAVSWFFAVIALPPLMPTALGGTPAASWAAATIGIVLAQAVLSKPQLNRALDHYLGRGPAPRLLMAVSGALALMAWVTGIAMVFTAEAADKAAVQGAGYALGVAPLPFYTTWGVVTRPRIVLGTVAAVALVAGTGMGLAGGLLEVGVPTVVSVFLPALLGTIVGRPNAWHLRVVWELEAARGVQARLAVAEERLRFARDMHDVMGRNLAVIALKSELAVQLARRERPEAVDQMVEVQRIAQESQREVREVVRGYRKADLHVELAGARSILRAAGISCRIEADEATDLPAEVQSALGWVVREGTTNVLRHAPDAGCCVIRARVEQERAVLVMENDGARHGGPGPDAHAGGSGLKGLRERLVPLGGTLESQRRPGGAYRLTVELPVQEAA